MPRCERNCASRAAALLAISVHAGTGIFLPCSRELGVKAMCIWKELQSSYLSEPLALIQGKSKGGAGRQTSRHRAGAFEHIHQAVLLVDPNWC